MKLHLPFRLGLVAALALVCAVLPGCAQVAQPQVRRELRAAQNNGARPQQNRPPQNRAARPGVEQWMQRHQNLSPDEQRRQLQNEPGFRQLPPQVQQQEMNELNRLQQMSPQQRNRRGALLQMTPVEREQFRTSVQQYMALPPDRRQMVRRAFAVLRTVPPSDRPAAMNSYPMMRGFSEQERQTLGNLLTWEPYFANGTPGAGP